MRKVFLLILIVLTTKSFGQTYTVSIALNYYGGCHGAKSWSFDGSNLIGSGSFITSGITNKTYPAVSLSNSFDLAVNFTCTPLGTATLDCIDDNTNSQTAAELIKGNLIGAGGCAGSIDITRFEPNNMSITSNKLSVCAGEQMDFIIPSPAGFPNEAYHWQYSLDDQVTWVDVPNTFNDDPTPNFSMVDILGSTHINYLNKQIYFRLGYGQNRPFTSPLAITYSSCAPVVTGINYIAPKCTGDPIQKVEVIFDRPLAADEVLNPIYMENTSNGAIRNQRGNVSFDTNNPLKYTFTNIGDLLEDGSTYKITYQAQKGGILTGTLTSSTQTFTYVDPAPLKYAISNSTQPTCFGGSDGSIEILLVSGTAPYHFYQDGTAVTPTLENGKYYLRGLSAKTEAYTIKVTDTNDCYEK